MTKLLVGLAALPFLVGVASAAQPIPLSDAQMDMVTAGQDSAASIVVSHALATAMGDSSADTGAMTSETADSQKDIALDQSRARAAASSALFRAAAVAHADSAAMLTFPARPFRSL